MSWSNNYPFELLGNEDKIMKEVSASVSSPESNKNHVVNISFRGRLMKTNTTSVAHAGSIISKNFPPRSRRYGFDKDGSLFEVHEEIVIMKISNTMRVR